MKSRKKLIILILVILLFLGIFLGASITAFIIFLNKDNKMLAIISYTLLAVFVLLVIVFMYLVNKYGPLIYNKTIEENHNEKE